jgi:MFS transporter, PPP family, 3-phenylpropionic acid transporter
MRKTFTFELVAMLVIVGLATMAMALLQPVLPLYLTSLNIDPTVLGLMFSTGMAGMVIGESSGGWLADRVGIRVPLFIGTFVCAPLVLAFTFTTSPAAIFAIFFFWGVVRAAIFGPGRGYIGTKVPLAHKATFMAVYAASMALSRSLGSLTSGFIVDARGFSWVFYIAAGIGVIGSIFVIFALRKRPHPAPVPSLPVPEKQADPAGPLFRNRLFIYQSAIAMVQFASAGISPFMALLAAEVAHLPAREVGILFTIGSVTNAILLIPMGRLADWRSKRTIMVVGLLISAAGQATIGLSHSFIQIAIGCVIQGTGGAMFSPAAVALLSENVPPLRQNTAMGIYGAFEDAGVIIGSALGGVIWSAFGPAPTFLILGTGVAVLGALMSFTLLRHRPPTVIRPVTGNDRSLN